MTDQQIFEKISPVLRKHSRLRGTDKPVQLAASLTNDLDINSSRMIDIVLETEDAFRISIPDAELEHMGNVQDVIEMVKRQMASA